MSRGSTCGLRPSPEVTPIALPVERRDLALRILGAAVGAGGLHPRPRGGRRHRARPAFPRRDPAVRLAPLARFRRDRGNPRRSRRGSATILRKARVRPGLRPQARPRRHPRGRILRPDPADDPRRPRSRAARAGDARRASARWQRAGPARRRDAADAGATPIACCAPIEHRVQMVDDAQTHCLPAEQRGARQCRAARTGSPTAPALLDLLAPARRARRGACSTAWRRTSAGGCRTTPTSCAASSRRWASPTRQPPRGTSATGARARRARCARRPRSRRSRRCCPSLMQRDRRRRRPGARAQPLRATSSSGCRAGSTSTACSRRGRSSPSCSPRSSPTRRRWPTSSRGGRNCSTACSTPRASPCRRRRRRVRASFSPRRCAASPTTSALDRVRRLVNERRFALGVQLIDRAPRPARRRRGLCAASPKARCIALGRGRRGASSRARTARFAGGELVILGLGRLGGWALTHASDLDLIYLYTAPAGRPVGRHASRSARTIISTGWRAG